MSLKRAIRDKLSVFFKGMSSTNEGQWDSDGGPIKSTVRETGRLERPTRSFEAFFEHLKRLGYAPSVCIDVGAATGTESIYNAFPDAFHIAFEPLPDFKEKLKETLSPFRHIIKDCALASNAGQATLLRHDDLFGSSIMHGRNVDEENVVQIRKSTLDIELSDCDLDGSVVLKTDCQGSDLLVLQGGIETLSKCDVVIVEASLFRFWGQHQPDFFDIVSFMYAQGFALYDLLDGLYRPRDAALGQLDLVFVKDRSSFRQDHYW